MQYQLFFIFVDEKYSSTLVGNMIDANGLSYTTRWDSTPPRRGNRKGSVEKSIHFATQRFFRTMTATTIGEAQRQLDRFCESIADKRPRSIAKLEAITGPDNLASFLREIGRNKPRVCDLAQLEPLRKLPDFLYPATILKTVTVGPSALVACEGNSYSVPPGLVGATVNVRRRLGTEKVEIISEAGTILAEHTRHSPGCGYVVRSVDHKELLQSEVLARFTTKSPCKSKLNRPPSKEALEEARKLLTSDEVVVDLGTYQRLVENMGFNEDREAMR